MDYIYVDTRNQPRLFNLGSWTHGFRIVVPFSMRIDNKMNAPLLEFIYTLYRQ